MKGANNMTYYDEQLQRLHALREEVRQERKRTEERLNERIVREQL